MNLNKIQYAGRLTAGVDIKTTASGLKIAKFTVAENHTFRTQQGETKTKACFVMFTAFGHVAENCVTYLHKGSSVFVEAHFDLNTWIDDKTGEKKSSMNYIADYVHFLGTNPKPAEGGLSGKDRAAGEKPEADEGLD